MLENMSDTEIILFILFCIELIIITVQAAVYKEKVQKYSMFAANMASEMANCLRESRAEHRESVEDDDPDMVCFDCKDGTFIRVHKDDLDEYGCPKSIPKLKFTIEE